MQVYNSKNWDQTTFREVKKGLQPFYHEGRNIWYSEIV